MLPGNSYLEFSFFFLFALLFCCCCAWILLFTRTHALRSLVDGTLFVVTRCESRRRERDAEDMCFLSLFEMISEAKFPLIERDMDVEV